MVAQRIIGFAKSLIVHGSSSRNKLKPNSIKCCVLTVARRLGPQLCERDPATVPSETLEDFYVNAIDQAAADSDNPPRLQATVAWALREFHSYLRREELAQPLNDMDVFKVPRGFLKVDAIIVSVDDVAKAIEYLRFEPNSKWSHCHREIAQVTILLGFFAGLRTMEGLGALRKDFPGGPLLPFRVLASDTRGLKTINAKRMVLMSIFMSPFEDFHQIASAWAQSDAQGDPNASLFDGATDDVVISIVNETLRAVTGNDRVRYYNLRHSFASWAITRLFLSELPDIPEMFPHLAKTSLWLQHSTDFRCSLYGNDRVSNDHAWAVATLLGHSRPNVSLANYCHTLDILLPEFLRVSIALQSFLSHRERLRLSGVDSVSGAYVKLPAHDITAGKQSALPTRPDEENREQQKIHLTESNSKFEKEAALKLRKEERVYALTLLRVRHPALRAPLVQATTHGDHSWMEQTAGLLSMPYARHRDSEKFGDYLGLTKSEVASIVDRNADICALKYAGSDKLLHRVTGVVASEAWAKNLVYPAIPPIAALDLATEFAAKIERFVEKNLDAPILLDYYCRNVRSESAGLVFRLSECRQSDGIKLVQQYRRLLFGLGIYDADLCFEGCDGTGSDFPCVDWYLNWGLRSRPTCRIINRHGKKAKAVASGEWLSITPSIASHDVKAKFNRVFFDGFRFAMLLAGIRLGKPLLTRS
jgi:hypothetical protein